MASGGIMTFKVSNLLFVTAAFSLNAGIAQARIFEKGNAADKVVATQPLLCLAGGASDDLWVEGWVKLLTATNGGDVVIIRPDSNRGTYESWIYDDSGKNGLPKVDSVTTIGLGKASDAFDARAVTAVRNAELVFFDGGDQSVYLNMIEGTPLEQALEYTLHTRHVPMGGTSAGMALLAGVDFTAKYPVSKKVIGVTSTYAMNDPTAKFVDLDRNTLVPPFLEQVITETHFSSRSRQGRLVAFMARAVYNNYGDINASNIKGIAADESTAYCYDTSTGLGKVYGAGSVYFTKGNAAIERITPGASLDWFAQRQAVKVYQIQGSQNSAASFDLATWSGTGGIEKYWYVDGTNTTNAVFGEN